MPGGVLMSHNLATRVNDARDKINVDLAAAYK